MSEAERRRGPAGSIYDLGYRPYDGKRLGRSYAALSLFTYSLRAVFGLGRSAVSKIFPFGLGVILLIPAVVQLGIAALAPRDLEVIRPEDYFGYTNIVLVLFCAVSAPEVIGRDQRHHTLSLYFSRALSPSDYVSAKLAALASALFIVTLVPQVLLYVGSAVAAPDLVDYVGDNLDTVPSIIASSLLVSVFMASLALTIANQTPRRAFATGGVLAFFVILSLLGGILVETTTGDVQKYALIVSPLDITIGAVGWIFGAAPAVDSSLAQSGLPGWACFLAALGYTLAPLLLLYRRINRLAV